MKTKIVLALLMVVIGGCYRPHWYRANTTYATLKADSQWCKTQIHIGTARSEMIEQYERCMQDKGYRLEGNQGEVGVKESSAKTIEQRLSQAGVDKNTKVYVVFQPMDFGRGGSSATYRYFHKKDCKHLWDVSTIEATVGEAIAEGKNMCPDCFR
jgi:hypothetical protein